MVSLSPIGAAAARVDRPLPGPGAAGLRHVRARDAAGHPRRRIACGRSPRPQRAARTRRVGVDRAQGRRAVVRRWLRDHPADAERCRARLPLDDQRPVPQRGRVRPGDARPGRGDDRGRRLRGPRARRRPDRRRGRLHTVVLVRAARRRDDSNSCASNARARAFLDGAGPAAIGAILGAAILLAEALQQAWQFAILAGARSRCLSPSAGWS